jgi:hypothetical protein
MSKKLGNIPTQEKMSEEQEQTFTNGINKGRKLQYRHDIELLEGGLEEACEYLHMAYEEAAKITGWSTQESTRVEWKDLPHANKMTMMLAVMSLREHYIGRIIDSFMGLDSEKETSNEDNN